MKNRFASSEKRGMCEQQIKRGHEGGASWGVALWSAWACSEAGLWRKWAFGMEIDIEKGEKGGRAERGSPGEGYFGGGGVS